MKTPVHTDPLHRPPRLLRLGQFLESIGGAIVAPRRLFDGVLEGHPGGLYDLLALLMLQIIAEWLPQLLQSLLYAVDVSIGGGIAAVVQTLTRGLFVPMIGALVGGALLRHVFSRHALPRAYDLAAICAIPAVTLQLGANLATRIAPGIGGDRARWAVFGVGACWFFGLLVAASQVVRRSEGLRRSAPRSDDSGREAGGGTS